jgi:hypothetical protein
MEQKLRKLSLNIDWLHFLFGFRVEFFEHPILTHRINGTVIKKKIFTPPVLIWNQTDVCATGVFVKWALMMTLNAPKIRFI